MVDVLGSFEGLRNQLCPQVDVPCQLLLSGFQVARIIGKGGTLIKDLRESSGAVVNILDKQLPVAFMNRDERIVLLRGSQDAIQAAVSGIIRSVFDGGAGGAASWEDQHQRAVEVMIPEVSCSHLIGEKGARIGALMEETSCDWHIVREPVSGLTEQKRLRITGPTMKNLESAVFKVHELMVELTKFGVLSERHFDIREGPTAAVDLVPRARGPGSGIAVNLLLAKEETAWVIGKRGSKINKLRELAKVSVNDAEVPPFNPQEAILEIAGAPLRELIHVLQLMLDDLMLRPGASNTTRLMVPTDHFGAVIGQGGSVIARIAEQSGAELHQQPAERHGAGLYRLRMLEVCGSDHERVAAAQAVFETVEEAKIQAGELTRSEPPSAPSPASAFWTTSPTPAISSSSPSEAVDYGSNAAAIGAAQPRAGGVSAEASSAVTAAAASSVANGGGWDDAAPTLDGLGGGCSWGEVVPAASVNNHSDNAASAGSKDLRDFRSRSAGAAAPAAQVAADHGPSSIGCHASSRAADMTCIPALSTPCSVAAPPTSCSAEHALLRVAPVAALSVAPAVGRGSGPPVGSGDNGRICGSSGNGEAAHATPPASCGGLALFLILPSREAAAFLASEELGIAKRTGSQVIGGTGSSGEHLLRIVGSPAENAAACYLVQEALWACGAFAGASAGSFGPFAGDCGGGNCCSFGGPGGGCGSLGGCSCGAFGGGCLASGFGSPAAGFGCW
mmetsp:Transcript_4400/g.10662  ORF Transcript_4400/g.10662 Transcript_4400/m.10662 type:complete len:732 (-) Transcript_4400:177-2372(-)